MTNYDLNRLNDKEFEILGADLLSKREGARFERFKPGRDAGVDGRFFCPDGHEWILQCKHWSATPLEKLVKHLEENELPKIKKLRPQRYFLVVSHALSRNDKMRIANVLAPYIASPADILGKEDLTDLLAAHPDVERKHYKLWLSSTNVLIHLLNKPIHDRSSFALEEILASAHLYVPTKSHDLAIEKLETLGTVIITGPAGIGKTTLADHLTLHYVAQDYALIRIAEEIREAEAVFDEDGKQLFYFDDFLGRNYLEALSGHKGTHIAQFINRIGRNRRKRFILTSRTTILNQGKLLIDIFQTNNLSRNEFEVTLDSFSEMDRARVLYNHIWHSTLQPMFIDALYQERRYREIIQHQNYNPRLIRYITDSERLSDCTPEQYWPYAKDLLDNPARVWENPFEAQHDDFGRTLVLLVTLNGRAIAQPELAEAYSRFIAHPDAGAMHGRRDFLLNIRHLSGSLLTRSAADKSSPPTLNLFNPSIGDFVLRRYATDIPSLRAGFSSLRSTSSLRALTNLSANSLIAASAARGILIYLLGQSQHGGYIGHGADYISLACLTLRKLGGNLDPESAIFRDAVRFVESSECPGFFRDVAELLVWGRQNELIGQDSTSRFVEAACENNPMSTELEQLSELVSCLDKNTSEPLMALLGEAAVAYLTNSVHDEFSDEDVFSLVGPGESYEAECILQGLIEEKLTHFGVTASESSIELIVEAFDVRDRMNEYFKESDYDSDHRVSAADTYIDEIDDLFERSR